MGKASIRDGKMEGGLISPKGMEHINMNREKCRKDLKLVERNEEGPSQGKSYSFSCIRLGKGNCANENGARECFIKEGREEEEGLTKHLSFLALVIYLLSFLPYQTLLLRIFFILFSC